MWMWTQRTAVIWGFSLKLGHSKALRSLCMCVYIYARFWSGSSERIIWLHRQALLQFCLAGVWAGVCLCIPLGQHGCVRLRPLKPGVLFKRPLGEGITRFWLSTREHTPAVRHLKRGTLKRLLQMDEECLHLDFSLSFPESTFLLWWDLALTWPWGENKPTLIFFLPCHLTSPACCVSSPLVSFPCCLYLLFSLPQAFSPHHLTFNPLIPQMHRVKCFRHFL